MALQQRKLERVRQLGELAASLNLSPGDLECLALRIPEGQGQSLFRILHDGRSVPIGDLRERIGEGVNISQQARRLNARLRAAGDSRRVRPQFGENGSWSWVMRRDGAVASA